ncbi:hypothetical protein SLEP1_g54501 [Rubroshorea leprosula]|uniref:Uncharacterized protein n=1 Tax=Rubroshorea leprosula TaxID=152421 RepID=A0AAV5MCL2_9ROSI|nr:hypothetical protein SLEP1_g54501 [Rubroshorea leprosula]
MRIFWFFFILKPLYPVISFSVIQIYIEESISRIFLSPIDLPYCFLICISWYHGDDDHDRESGTSGTQIRKKKQREYNGFRKNFTKAKQMFHRKKSTSSNNGDRGSDSSCFCFRGQSCTLESSNTSDPNDPNLFSYDMLKTLIQKNGFYSKELNTHLP